MRQWLVVTILLATAVYALSFRVDTDAPGTKPVVVDSTGNVGIGTGSPSRKNVLRGLLDRSGLHGELT